MDNYFKSIGHKYAFAINCLSGNEQMKMLEITFNLFTNKKARNKWHNDILVQLELNNCNDDMTLNKLDQIISNMD